MASQCGVGAAADGSVEVPLEGSLEGGLLEPFLAFLSFFLVSRLE